MLRSCLTRIPWTNRASTCIRFQIPRAVPYPYTYTIKPNFIPVRTISSRIATMGPTIKLSSGHEMPQVGFGLWKVDNAVAADTVYNAIKVGYRLFDGACGK